MTTKTIKIGSHVVLTAEAEFAFDPERRNVIHEVTDVVRGGYRIAPIKGEGVDRARVVGCFAEDVRPVGGRS